MKTPDELRQEYLAGLQAWATEHPVPLPGNVEMLRDLANLGVPGAAEEWEWERRGEAVQITSVFGQ